jgi:hypothetical protein
MQQMSRTKSEEGRPRRKEDLQEAEESRGPQKAENFRIANFFFFLFSVFPYRVGAGRRLSPAGSCGHTQNTFDILTLFSYQGLIDTAMFEIRFPRRELAD